MASASLGNGGVGSSRSGNGFKNSSSSVDWLGREMLEMRLRDRVDRDEDRVSCCFCCSFENFIFKLVALVSNIPFWQCLYFLSLF